MENLNFDDRDEEETIEENSTQESIDVANSQNLGEKGNQDKEVIYLTTDDDVLQMLRESPNSVLVFETELEEFSDDNKMLLEYARQNNINVETITDDVLKTESTYSLWEDMKTTISEADYKNMNTIRNFILNKNIYGKKKALQKVIKEINKQSELEKKGIGSSVKAGLYTCFFSGDEGQDDDLSRLCNMLITHEEILKAEYYKKNIAQIQGHNTNKQVLAVLKSPNQQLLKGKRRTTEEQLEDEKSLLAQKEKIENSTRSHIVDRYNRHEKSKWVKDKWDYEYNIQFKRELGVIDQDLLSTNTERLLSLINKFPYVRGHIKKHGLLISANDFIFSELLGCVQPHDVSLNEIMLDFDGWKSSEDFIKAERERQDTGFSMPCAENMLDVYCMTHEFGHVIHNILTSKFILEKLAEQEQVNSRQLKQKSDSSKSNIDLPTADELTPPNLKDIQYIAKLQEKVAEMHITNILNMTNGEFSVKLLSHYARSPRHHKKGKMYCECFAEIFANSQCGKPNALGIAMNKYLSEILK